MAKNIQFTAWRVAAAACFLTKHDTHVMPHTGSDGTDATLALAARLPSSWLPRSPLTTKFPHERQSGEQWGLDLLNLTLYFSRLKQRPVVFPKRVKYTQRQTASLKF